jgi:hypothetical protein
MRRGGLLSCLWLHAGVTPGAIRDDPLHVYLDDQDSSRILAQASPIATASIKVRQNENNKDLHVYTQWPRWDSGPMTPLSDAGFRGGVKVLFMGGVKVFSIKTYTHADGAFRTGIRCSWHQI